MKERPILFNGAMVRAILDGTKTQDATVVTVRHENNTRIGPKGHQAHIESPEALNHCPYGQPGDRLWVRETWAPVYLGYDYCELEYRAGQWQKRFERPCLGEKAREQAVRYGEKTGWGMTWATPIHMPRWASRITLRVTDVRVERVQEIYPKDIVAEGVQYEQHYEGLGNPCDEIRMFYAWQELWDSINAKQGFGWDKNPWVWVVTFEREVTR